MAKDREPAIKSGQYASDQPEATTEYSKKRNRGGSSSFRSNTLVARSMEFGLTINCRFWRLVWAHVLHAITVGITGGGRKTLHFKNRASRPPVHAMVRTVHSWNGHDQRHLESTKISYSVRCGPVSLMWIGFPACNQINEPSPLGVSTSKCWGNQSVSSPRILGVSSHTKCSSGWKADSFGMAFKTKRSVRLGKTDHVTNGRTKQCSACKQSSMVEYIVNRAVRSHISSDCDLQVGQYQVQTECPS
ncbi:hypothetical protein RE6C_02958 [Rhodopirellula europaea 6C]|uniref:Uncharacterized protein n=1 Tax=Rhodopirellula europaea 6C TaxID=1263867 RepID=M2B279_9BACT|nr:hypothetical protein RE6C_02958 [Rhodopirellula europaea 6C]